MLGLRIDIQEPSSELRTQENDSVLLGDLWVRTKGLASEGRCPVQWEHASPRTRPNVFCPPEVIASQTPAPALFFRNPLSRCRVRPPSLFSHWKPRGSWAACSRGAPQMVPEKPTPKIQKKTGAPHFCQTKSRHNNKTQPFPRHNRSGGTVHISVLPEYAGAPLAPSDPSN